MGSQTQYDFNPRSPHGERLIALDAIQRVKVFQSTLPAWGATGSMLCESILSKISIHAPRMGSDMMYKGYIQLAINFNPRSPHGERRSRSQMTIQRLVFQSTLPAWGATLKVQRKASVKNISIHAPRMGSDNNIRNWGQIGGNFNPRSPHGERQYNQSIQQ